MKRISCLLFILPLLGSTCNRLPESAEEIGKAAPFVWNGANVYFLLTDRFCNGDPGNDLTLGRTDPAAPLRGFMGGDISGITQKIRDNYFDSLGINAIWFTPVFEQIHGATDEGTGLTYGYHGYWIRDWTRLDPNFGTGGELALLVEQAHAQGIRVLLDVVINHTGPVTAKDPVWPAEWVRTTPKCVYTNYQNTVSCTLVENLPDVRTESDEAVALPQPLLDTWEREGRLNQELAELDAFFARTGYPRAPKYYIIKWLTDLIRRYGVDGFRCDTGKHIEESVWAALRQEADLAFSEWKKRNPGKVLDDNGFYMVGEVYGYAISNKRQYDFGNKRVDYFDHGFNSLINFEFKADAEKKYEPLFQKYSDLLGVPLAGYGVLNYIASHDDGGPFDRERKDPFTAANKLLLCPGASQIYYGDETARPLTIPGAEGDAHLRSFMNWEDIEQNTRKNGYQTREVLEHWRKLGQFRRAHPAVGAGTHQKLSASPYLFKRTYRTSGYADVVVVGLDLPPGQKELAIGNDFPDGTVLRDYYSGQSVTVNGGTVSLNSPGAVVLLGL